MMRASQAAEHYHRAAGAGESGAWVSLAALTELGLGGPADRVAALRLYARALADGDPEAAPHIERLQGLLAKQVLTLLYITANMRSEQHLA